VMEEASQFEIGAIDGRMYKAQGSAWHKSGQRKSLVPPKLRNVDADSQWPRVALEVVCKATGYYSKGWSS
jgi:hypothetical protein